MMGKTKKKRRKMGRPRPTRTQILLMTRITTHQALIQQEEISTLTTTRLRRSEALMMTMTADQTLIRMTA